MQREVSRRAAEYKRDGKEAEWRLATAAELGREAAKFTVAVELGRKAAKLDQLAARLEEAVYQDMLAGVSHNTSRELAALPFQ